jgi:hypothetical protein
LEISVSTELLLTRLSTDLPLLTELTIRSKNVASPPTMSILADLSACPTSDRLLAGDILACFDFGQLQIQILAQLQLELLVLAPDAVEQLHGFGLLLDAFGLGNRLLADDGRLGLAEVLGGMRLGFHHARLAIPVTAASCAWASARILRASASRSEASRAACASMSRCSARCLAASRWPPHPT